MATFTASLSGSSVVNGTKSFTISDPDVQILIDFLIKKYTFQNNPPPTKAQALTMWIQEFVDASTNQVQRGGVQTTVPPPIVFS